MSYYRIGNGLMKSGEGGYFYADEGGWKRSNGCIEYINSGEAEPISEAEAKHRFKEITGKPLEA